MKRLITLIMLLQLCFASEGMWLTTQISDLNLQNKGFNLIPGQIYSENNISISDAIVWLGGCSASFVSPKGLMLTNHHCAFSGLQKASARDNINYIEKGYTAASMKEELPLPGQCAYVLQSIEDVSRDVINAGRYAPDMVSREDMQQRRIQAIVEAEEKNGNGTYCQIAKMYEGESYLKYTYKKYKDVRAVFAPPASIGKYGGDTDNWMWPRHTGDFTFLRVYQGPDSSAAAYSPDNIPLLPGNHLNISKENLNAGDPAFIMGFPYRTSRYLTSLDVEWTLDKVYERKIADYKNMLSKIEQFYARDKNSILKLANWDAGINNSMKKYQGIMEGMDKTDFIALKKKNENEFSRFIKEKYKYRKRYSHILGDMKNLYREKEEFYEYDKALDGFGYYSGVLFDLADYAYEVAQEREKSQSDREPGFSEKRVEEFIEKIPYRYYAYYKEFDKYLLHTAIEKAKKLPSSFSFYDFPAEDEKWVYSAYETSKMEDPDYVKRLFNLNVSQIENLDDPIIQLAVSLYAPKQDKKQRLKFWDARMNELRKLYIEALKIQKDNTLIYPDANSTMRLTYGYIAGYSPKDAVDYKPFTTLNGVAEKNTGKKPFNCPDKLLSLANSPEKPEKWIDPELGDIPVCFLMKGDITGGNSGSAVMDKNGDLIGLAFDGNYEAMTSDWMYQDDIQRVIVADIRYILFLTEYFAESSWLLEEMDIK